MNLPQLTAVILLRWQISRNQWRRAGAFNAALMSVLAAFVLLTSVIAFFGALIGGSLLLPRATPDHLLILWDVVVGLFLSFWMLGLMMELQRSELLSLDKLLHLPVSLFGAFLLNYLSSWFSFSLAFFLPLMVGLSLALVATRGAAMLLMFPLIVGFLIMVSGATYQFRGWLARLMENKRRRGTVVALITISFVLLSQSPNLINLAFFRSSQNSRQQSHDVQQRQLAELAHQVQSGEITSEEFNRRSHDLLAAQAAAREDGLRTSFQSALQWLHWANWILPIGWLPFGAQTLAQGRPLPALLGSAGMFAIGFICLRQSYLGTMRAYTGGKSSSSSAVTIPAIAAKTKEKTLLMARQIPFASAPVSAVALASLCSVVRSPEGKMMLLSPLLFLGMFGALLVLGPGTKLPDAAVPPIAMLSIGVSLLSVMQFMFNAFGFDRNGFRAYILMPVDRRDLLLGKNLSLIPLVLGLGGLSLCLLALTLPIRISHVPATLIQTVIAYLLACLAGNLLSIYAPVTMALGSLRPQNIRAGPMLLQFLCMFLLPVALLPAATAWGLEVFLEYLTGVRLIPWYLLLSAAQAVLIAIFYDRMLAAQGPFLHQREPRILEIVSAVQE